MQANRLGVLKAGAAPAQNEWGGDKTKKIETYSRSLWHTKCSIIFLRRKT